MGHGSEQPYIYDPPANRKIAYPYSDFNPKAVTQASYARLSTISTDSKPKREGPLINFNQHPDSYVIVTGSQEQHKPLNPNTKKAVVSVRWVQFFFRLVQEIGALGLLVATICIKGTSGAETYLLRIPQAWDSLITLYAVYHLIRPAKSRTPLSSASYHMFALIMDVALIPLYIYITLASNSNRQLPVPQYKADGEEVNGDWRWTSFFDTQADTNLLLQITFLASAVMSGLHLISCTFDLYLIVIFRKISNLPPDMNPLEDNLTSRRSTKHKYKNSDATLTGSMSDLSDAEKKRLAHLSGSTLNDSCNSVAKDSFMESRSIPFGQSRTGSKTNLAFSPHNPESARWSKHQYDGQQDFYREAATNPRRSRYEIRPDGKLEVRTRRGSHSPTKRGPTVVESMNVISQYSRSGSSSPSKHENFADIPPIGSHHPTASSLTARTASPVVPNAAPTSELIKTEQKGALLQDNWYVIDDDGSDLGMPSRDPTPAPPASEAKFSKQYNGHHHPLHDRHDSFEPVTRYRDNVGMPKPLGMHPPTPPEQETEDHNFTTKPQHHDGGDGVSRSLTAASRCTESSSVYSESAPSLKSSTAPKGKYYGDLVAATRGIRNGNNTDGRNPYAYGGLPPPSPQPSRTPSPEKKVRVISRTGADIADESVLYVPESRSGVRSRRDVSGKVAEEGRGGAWNRR